MNNLLFFKADIAKYVQKFNALDEGKKGFVSVNDIRFSLKVISFVK